MASAGEDDGRSDSIRDRVVGGAAPRLDLQESEQTVEVSFLRGRVCEPVSVSSMPFQAARGAGIDPFLFSMDFGNRM
jgi:hypothetical protein